MDKKKPIKNPSQINVKGLCQPLASFNLEVETCFDC